MVWHFRWFIHKGTAGGGTGSKRGLSPEGSWRYWLKIASRSGRNGVAGYQKPKTTDGYLAEESPTSDFCIHLFFTAHHVSRGYRPPNANSIFFNNFPYSFCNNWARTILDRTQYLSKNHFSSAIKDKLDGNHSWASAIERGRCSCEKWEKTTLPHCFCAVSQNKNNHWK